MSDGRIPEHADDVQQRVGAAERRDVEERLGAGAGPRVTRLGAGALAKAALGAEALAKAAHARVSARIFIAAFRPGAPMMPPPGWTADPASHRPSIGVR